MDLATDHRNLKKDEKLEKRVNKLSQKFSETSPQPHNFPHQFRIPSYRYQLPLDARSSRQIFFLCLESTTSTTTAFSVFRKHTHFTYRLRRKCGQHRLRWSAELAGYSVAG